MPRVHSTTCVTVWNHTGKEHMSAHSNMLRNPAAGSRIIQQVQFVRPVELDTPADLGWVLDDEIFRNSLGITKLAPGLHECNATHATRYRYSEPAAASHAGDRVVRLYLWHGTQGRYNWNGTTTALPTIPSRAGHGARDVYLFFTREPPSVLDVDRVRGFDGELNYRRDAAVTLPFYVPSAFARAMAQLPHEPATKHSVGIYVDNCLPPMRNRVITALRRAPGLTVESYGLCQPTVNKSTVRYWHDRRMRYHPEAQEHCKRHRVLFAAQHTACADYVNDNLFQALHACGAIPLVLTVGGLPDYEALFTSDVAPASSSTRGGAHEGAEMRDDRRPPPLAIIDAARPGWLQEVRRVLDDDEYYRRLVMRGRRRAMAVPSVESGVEARRLHCAFHDVDRSPAARRELRWPRCRTCDGLPLRVAHRKTPAEDVGSFMEATPCPDMEWAAKLEDPHGIHSWYQGV